MVLTPANVRSPGMDLAGRHIVVTGGASGIGRACALRFADEDAKVTVADLDDAGAQRTAGEIDGIGVQADVGRESDITALIETAQRHHGPIDVFFSNAGITGPAGGPEIANDDWDLLWRVNVMSHIWAARALLPAMLERGEGYLVSTASAAGLLSQLGALGYAATKHAAVAVAEWIDITYRDRGVRASCLCPQFVNTPMVVDNLDFEKLRPIAVIIEPEQVADAVVEAVRDERFLILPHPEVADYMRNRATDHARWLGGMRHLQEKLGGFGRDQQ
jgi:NAD(P)-dependent dehydrogenase (short-subunit alcohol dehydrogenase family)